MFKANTGEGLGCHRDAGRPREFPDWVGEEYEVVRLRECRRDVDQKVAYNYHQLQGKENFGGQGSGKMRIQSSQLESVEFSKVARMSSRSRPEGSFQLSPTAGEQKKLGVGVQEK